VKLLLDTHAFLWAQDLLDIEKLQLLHEAKDRE